METVTFKSQFSSNWTQNFIAVIVWIGLLDKRIHKYLFGFLPKFWFCQPRILQKKLPFYIIVSDEGYSTKKEGNSDFWFHWFRLQFLQNRFLILMLIPKSAWAKLKNFINGSQLKILNILKLWTCFSKPFLRYKQMVE